MGVNTWSPIAKSQYVERPPGHSHESKTAVPKVQTQSLELRCAVESQSCCMRVELNPFRRCAVQCDGEFGVCVGALHLLSEHQKWTLARASHVLGTGRVP